MSDVQVERQSNSGRSNRRLWILLVVVIPTIAGIVGVIYGVHSMGRDFEKADRAEAGTSLTEKGLDSAPVLSPEAIDAKSRFDSNIGDANNAVRDGLEIHGLSYGDFFPIDAGPASTSMTPEQIVARDTAKQMWVRMNPDHARAKLDATIIAPAGTSSYQAQVEIIDSTETANHDSIDPDGVKGKPFHFTSGTHDGVTSQGDTWLIATSPAAAGGTYVGVYEWYKNSDGDGGEYLLVDSFSKKSTPGFTETYADILPAIMHS